MIIGGLAKVIRGLSRRTFKSTGVHAKEEVSSRYIALSTMVAGCALINVVERKERWYP